MKGEIKRGMVKNLHIILATAVQARPQAAAIVH